LENQSKQVDALVKDPQKLSELDKAIASGRVQGEQLVRLQALKQQLQTFKQDPQSLNQQVEQAQTKIRGERLEAEKQTRTGALKLGLRTGLNSLLLAIGYIVIGWTGFRSLGNSR
jgi:TolA-binding protein